MSQERWTEVDRYITHTLVATDAALDAALAANAEAGLPAHDVSPAQGKLLELLARIAGRHPLSSVAGARGFSVEAGSPPKLVNGWNNPAGALPAFHRCTS